VGTAVAVSVGLGSGVSVGIGVTVAVASGVEDGVKVGIGLGVSVAWDGDAVGSPADAFAAEPWSVVLSGSVATVVTAGSGESTAMELGTEVFVGVGVMLAS
jgi:hypothetical protein